MDICGHREIRARLAHIANQKFQSQSYLFSGPKRLGKSLVAREFALALIGSAALPDGFHPDLLTLAGVKDEKTGAFGSISIEAIHEMQMFLSRFPESGRYKVAVVDGAERLTDSAENALLKVLEEPNSSSVIILITHRPGKLLSTVRSRLFPVAFSLVPQSELEQFFQEEPVLPDFFFSLGLPGLIYDAQSDPAAFDEVKRELRDLFQLSNLSWAGRIALAESLATDPIRAEALLEVWLIGLSRRLAGTGTEMRAHAVFLEAILETLDVIVSRQGSPRLAIEKLFTAA